MSTTAGTTAENTAGTTTETTDGTARPPRSFGVAWVVWRQHRTTAWTALAVLAALCAELLWLRGAMTAYLAEHGLNVPCAKGGDACAAYQVAAEGFLSRYSGLLTYNGRVLEFLPLLAGVIVAGPVIARELESGTYKVVWTQSVSPLRWFAAKLALPVLALLAGASALAAVYSWTWSSVGLLERDWIVHGPRWYETFDALGPAPVAGVLAGCALGALAGLLVRRTLPAMAVTAVACVLLYWPLTAVRPYLTDPVTETVPVSAGYPPAVEAGDSWRYERGMTTPSGGRLPDAGCTVTPSIQRCVTGHGATGWYVDYHPASHFRRLQWTQAGIVTGAAALLAAGAVWRVRRLGP
ncbi:translation initiation factor IF-2 [Streptomyces klenkii]|uniref:translation initiation factor IF-2 n=1 Tax=Streptomyces klenkii TaxID=1420899 RepID=UPI00342E34B7